MTAQNFNWNSAARTETGKVRKLNEDAVLTHSQFELWVVADGMGGHAAGDVASQMIVDALAQLRPPTRLSELVEFVEYRVLQVNERLFEMGQAQNQIIGSTIVALFVVEDYCAYMWAGDSRLYRFRDAELVQMTTDHTQAELYIEQGLIEREDAAQFQARSRITRAVGASDELILDVDIALVEPGDRFLLCSDGLDKHLSHDEISDALSEGTAKSTTDDLIEMTLTRGAADNVTVCVIDVQQ